MTEELGRQETRLLSFICHVLTKEHATAAGQITDFRLFTPIHDVAFREPLHVCLCNFPQFTVYAGERREE